MLDTLSKTRFAELAASRADPFAVHDTARQWHEEGDNERAIALLEPWFGGDAPLVGKIEPLFNQLMDCYLALGNERKRDRLVAAVLERGDRELRAAALQRRATMLADRGDDKRAWEGFSEAHLAFRALEDMDRGASGERFIELAERLIAFNSNDNHGFREPLSRAYLARGSPEKARALTERYPDDISGLILNRILALVRLNRRGAALTALHGAARHQRVAIEMLLADAPKQPRPDAGYGIIVGGKEEAWIYRAAHRALWQQDGAFDRLRARPARSSQGSAQARVSGNGLRWQGIF